MIIHPSPLYPPKSEFSDIWISEITDSGVFRYTTMTNNLSPITEGTNLSNHPLIYDDRYASVEGLYMYIYIYVYMYIYIYIHIYIFINI
jgi:hypothetical protein